MMAIPRRAVEHMWHCIGEGGSRGWIFFGEGRMQGKWRLVGLTLDDRLFPLLQVISL